MVLVNEAVMADEKTTIQSNLASVPPDVNFVSTNDFLTSWFFRKSTASLGLLCVVYPDTVLSQYCYKKNLSTGTIGRNRWGTIVYPLHTTGAVETWLVRQSLSWLKQGEGDLLERNFGSKLPSPWL